MRALRTLRTARGRRGQATFLIEGMKLVREALAALAPVQEVLVTADREEALAAFVDGDVPFTRISAAQAERLADTRTPQGCFAVVRDSRLPLPEALATLPRSGPVSVLVLDGVQDPGNTGTMIRIAAAFDVDLVLCGPRTADPTHPKVLRAATGAWFHVRTLRVPAMVPALDTLRDVGCGIYGAVAGGRSVYSAPLISERRAIIVGSEGAGLSPEALDRLDGTLSVPISKAVESLNVAVAAGILLAELHIQDRSRRVSERTRDG